MIYRTVGLMSGSSLDGLDIVYAVIEENGGKWSYQIESSDCIAYSDYWQQKLQQATRLSAYDYLVLHTEYGHYLGNTVNDFIEKNGLQFKISVIGSHGHTTFHNPGLKMTAQLGDGAAIAAVTGLPVVSDLRALDVALGGQGAPIVPIGEQLLFAGYSYFLNLGGIANLSAHTNDAAPIAFDICPANRVLNMLAALKGQAYDAGGALAAAGQPDIAVLQQLNALDYYQQPFPKSLANEWGTDVVFPILQNSGLLVEDALSTYIEHIAMQVKNALLQASANSGIENKKLLITGGGAHNSFLVQRISAYLNDIGFSTEVPDVATVNYKEALVMALIGVLRWREENNVLSSVTGASRNSVGGAMWMGQDA